MNDVNEIDMEIAALKRKANQLFACHLLILIGLPLLLSILDIRVPKGFSLLLLPYIIYFLFTNMRLGHKAVMLQAKRILHTALPNHLNPVFECLSQLQASDLTTNHLHQLTLKYSIIC